MDTFEQGALAAVRERPVGETPLRAFVRFILDRSVAWPGDGRRRVAELTRLTTASPSLNARERQIMADYTEAGGFLAEETGVGPDDIDQKISSSSKQLSNSPPDSARGPPSPSTERGGAGAEQAASQVAKRVGRDSIAGHGADTPTDSPATSAIEDRQVELAEPLRVGEDEDRDDLPRP